MQFKSQEFIIRIVISNKLSKSFSKFSFKFFSLILPATESECDRIVLNMFKEFVAIYVKSQSNLFSFSELKFSFSKFIEMHFKKCWRTLRKYSSILFFFDAIVLISLTKFEKFCKINTSVLVSNLLKREKI